MALKIWELVGITLSALVMGVYWGPWIALSRSYAAFAPDVFLAITHRMSQNLASLMTVLAPAALLALTPVLYFSYHAHSAVFLLTLIGLLLFLLALLVTVLVEVPLVQQFDQWTVSTLPGHWQQKRDRWGRFHLIRVFASLIGLACLVAGAVLV